MQIAKYVLDVCIIVIVFLDFIVLLFASWLRFEELDSLCERLPDDYASGDPVFFDIVTRIFNLRLFILHIVNLPLGCLKESFLPQSSNTIVVHYLIHITE